MPLYRYLLTNVLLSQRYLPPVVVFLAAMSVGTTSGSGPLLQSYSFCVVAMLACSTWLTVTVVNQEDPIQRKVTLVTIGSSAHLLATTIAVALTCCVPLIATGLGYPILAGQHIVSIGAVIAGAVAQLAAALVGITVGLLTSRLVIPRIGVATLVAVGTLLAMLLIRWISPIMPLVGLLSNGDSPSETATPLALLTVISATMLIIGATITRAIADRRE